VLTANGLMAYVYQKVGQDNRSQQTPHYGHLEGDGDFVLRVPGNEHLTAEVESDYLVQTVAEIPETDLQAESAIIKPSFAVKSGYGEPTHPSFGRNEWSRRLGEFKTGTSWSMEISRSFSWLSLIVESVASKSIVIDIAAESRRLPNSKASSDKPFERFMIPQSLQTTINSVALFDEIPGESGFWKRYLRLDKQGNLEYANGFDVFQEHRGVRFFKYVQVIGTIWQFIFFSKRPLAQNGYTSGVRLLVNLVGTRDTILGDFSGQPGESERKWLSPFERDVFFDGESLLNLKCPDANLQLEYKFVLANMNETESQIIIIDAARQLGLAYNHQSSPRCFNYNTEVFPWPQFFDGRRYYSS
jgi:hypothetical protein